MTNEKRYGMVKKTTTKSKGKYVCPECNEDFTLRKDANKHQAVKQHMGAILVQEKAEKKETKKKANNKKAPKKPNKKRVKMMAAAKRYLELIESGKSEKDAIKVVSKEVGESVKKINGWFDTLKGEARRKEKNSLKKNDIKDKKGETPIVEEVIEEEEDPGTIHRFVRVGNDTLKNIKDVINNDTGFHHILNPTTNNNLIYIKSENDYYAFDYLMFLHDFVELEMDIGDISYVLEFYSNKKHKLNNKLQIHDIAESLDRWIDDVDDGGSICVGYDKDESLTISQIIGRLSEFDERWMGCVGGIWDKPKYVSKKKEDPKTPPLSETSDRDVTVQVSIDEYTNNKVDTVDLPEDEEEDELDILLRKDVNSMTEDEWQRYQELSEQANAIDKEIDDSIIERDTSKKNETKDTTTTAIVKTKDDKDKKDDKEFNPDSKMYDDSGGVSPYGAEYGAYGYSSHTKTTPKVKGISFHPVYGIDINRIYTDRVIDINLYHPPDPKD
jgi:hypothetical protein